MGRRHRYVREAVRTADGLRADFKIWRSGPSRDRAVTRAALLLTEPRRADVAQRLRERSRRGTVRSVNNNRAEGVSVQSSLMIGGRQLAGLPRSVVACSREILQALEQGATEGGGNEAQEGRGRPGHGALAMVDTPQLGLFQWMGRPLGESMNTNDGTPAAPRQRR